MNEPMHVSDSESFQEDDEGFFDGHCSCGWSSGPVPDSETLTDALMAHAYAAGFTAGAAVEREWAARNA